MREFELDHHQRSKERYALIERVFGGILAASPSNLSVPRLSHDEHQHKLKQARNTCLRKGSMYEANDGFSEVKFCNYCLFRNICCDEHCGIRR